MTSAACWLTSLAAVSTVMLVACADPVMRARGGPRYTMRDSAGITIIEYRAPDTTEIATWRIADEPTLVIGDDRRGPEYALTFMNGLTRLSNGNIVAGLMFVNDNRMYDSTGAFLSKIGRKGNGPGEYNDSYDLASIRGDTIAIYNRYPERVLIFAPDGEHVRTTSLVKLAARARSDLPSFEFADFFADGAVLASHNSGERAWPPGGLLVDSVQPVRIEPGGKVLAAYGKRWLGDHIRMFTTKGASSPADKRVSNLPFSPRKAGWGKAGRQIYYSTMDGFEIELWSEDGRLARIIRMPTLPVLRTAADGPRRDVDASITYSSPLPDTLQALIRVAADRLGNIWVTPHPRAFAVATGSLVFDSTGLLRARVDDERESSRVPSQWRLVFPYETGNDYILAAGIDSDDAWWILLRRLMK